jgi:hypothetical protein
MGSKSFPCFETTTKKSTPTDKPHKNIPWKSGFRSGSIGITFFDAPRMFQDKVTTKEVQTHPGKKNVPAVPAILAVPGHGLVNG